MTRSVRSGDVKAAVTAATLVLAAGPGWAQGEVAIDPDDIGGMVTGPNGPEAGVWVFRKPATVSGRGGTEWSTHQRPTPSPAGP